jgi:hypothetical protein
LLSHGVNNISYEMRDRKKSILDAGQFQVYVHRNPDLQCPTANYTSFNENDCEGSGTNLCGRYFADVGSSCK